MVSSITRAGNHFIRGHHDHILKKSKHPHTLGKISPLGIDTQFKRSYVGTSKRWSIKKGSRFLPHSFHSSSGSMDITPSVDRLASQTQKTAKEYLDHSNNSAIKKKLKTFLRSQLTNQKDCQREMQNLFSKSILSQEPCKTKIIPNSAQKLSQDELNQNYQSNQQVLIRNKKFLQELKEVLTDKSTSKRIKHLEKWIYDQEGGIERFNHFELQTIFQNLYDLSAYEQMVEMMESTENPEFCSDPLNIEFYVRAQLKSAYANTNNAEAVVQILLNENPNSPEAHGILGVIHAIKRKAAWNLYKMLEKGENDSNILSFYLKCFPPKDHSVDLKEQALNHYYESLEQSRAEFEIAFNTSLDPRYGLRLMCRLLEQGETQEAIEVAKQIQLCCIRDNVLYSNNISVVRAYIASILVSGNHRERLAELELLLISLCQNQRTIDNTLLNFEILSENTVGETKNQIDALINKLLVHSKILKKNPLIKQSALKNSELQYIQERKKRSEETFLFENYTYSLRGQHSNYIDGNFKFGACLPAALCNRADIKFFNEILEEPISNLVKNEPIRNSHVSLNKIENPYILLDVLDKHIREVFKTEKWDLEFLQSEGHKRYDHIREQLFSYSGIIGAEDKKALLDSKTNISAIYVLGIGDCRHHAQVKQILFDLWQKQRLDTLIHNMSNAEKQGNSVELKRLKVEFRSISSLSLVTFSGIIQAPVVKDRETENSRFELNETGEKKPIEEHTLNLLFKYNRENKIESVMLVDSFYQEKYPWKSVNIEFKGKSIENGLHFSEIDVWDSEKNEWIKVPVTVTPTSYAHEKPKYDKNNDTKIVGQPVELPNPRDTIARRDEMNHFLDRLDTWPSPPTINSVD